MNKNKEREIIKSREVLFDGEDWNYYSEPNEGWECVDEDQVGFDSEKGFVEMEVIYRRVEDNKFFKLEYTDYGQGQNSIKNEMLKQVFPEKITTTIYE